MTFYVTVSTSMLSTLYTVYCCSESGEHTLSCPGCETQLSPSDVRGGSEILTSESRVLHAVAKGTLLVGSRL